jgi:phytoene/squalene synthetase
MQQIDAWASATLRQSSGSLWWAVRLLCRREGFLRFCRVYSYFRWADDIVDAPGRDPSRVREFIARQQRLFGGAEQPSHEGERALSAALNEEAPRILRASVGGMLRALAFDAWRESRPLTQDELDAQVARIGDAYLAGILACSGHEEEVPAEVLPLSRAATATHYVRDLFIDRNLGYFNLPREAAGRFGIDPEQFDERAVAPYAVERLKEISGWFGGARGSISRLSTGRARSLVRLLTAKYGRLAQRLAKHYQGLLYPVAQSR